MTEGGTLEQCLKKALLLPGEGKQEDRLEGSCGHHKVKEMLTRYPAGLPCPLLPPDAANAGVW